MAGHGRPWQAMAGHGMGSDPMGSDPMGSDPIRSVARSMARSIARSPDRSFGRSLGRSVARFGPCPRFASASIRFGPGSVLGLIRSRFGCEPYRNRGFCSNQRSSLAQVVVPLAPAVVVMIYCVYKLSYKTIWGGARIYIGYTGQKERRKVWHELKAKAWNQHRDPQCKLKWKDLEKNVASKPLALALEAFHSARAVVAERRVARGGPWSLPSLDKKMWDECTLASTLSLSGMLAYARDHPDGSLGCHLSDLDFKRGGGAAARRGVVVTLKGRSGCPGVQTRRRQLAEGVLKRHSDDFRRLHRGVHPATRRKPENSKRSRR